MPVSIVCPKCEASYSMNVDVAEGRNVRCAYCNFKFPYHSNDDTDASPQQQQQEESEPADNRPKAIVGNVISDCRIEKKIAQGGMGAVFKGHHVNLDIPVAVKFLPKSFAKASKKNIDQFIMEARSAAKLQHHNIIGVLNVGFEKGLHFIIMQFVDGKNLKEILGEKKQFEIEEAIEIISQVCDALEVARSHNIVHRDIKASNIMIDSHSVVKLADLGLAQQLNDETFKEKRNSLIGTPYFMSPEQARNPRAVDHRADIYSLGCTFYQMLTGELPFKSTDLHEILRMHLEAPIPNPRDIVAAIPKKLADIVMKMMAKKPEDRYTTSLEVKDQLQLVSNNLKKSSGRITKVTSGLKVPSFKAAAAKVTQGRSNINRDSVRPPISLKIVSGLTILLLLVNIAFFFHKKYSTYPGLRYQVYDGPFEDFETINKIDEKPVKEGVIKALGIPNGVTLEKGQVLTFTGLVDMGSMKECEFTLTSDGSSKLYLGGKLIIDHKGDHDVEALKTSVTFNPGSYKFYLVYMNKLEDKGLLRLEVNAPNGKPAEFSEKDFSYKLDN